MAVTVGPLGDEAPKIRSGPEGSSRIGCFGCRGVAGPNRHHFFVTYQKYASTNSPKPIR